VIVIYRPGSDHITDAFIDEFAVMLERLTVFPSSRTASSRLQSERRPFTYRQCIAVVGGVKPLFTKRTTVVHQIFEFEPELDPSLGELSYGFPTYD